MKYIPNIAMRREVILAILAKVVSGNCPLSNCAVKSHDDKASLLQVTEPNEAMMVDNEPRTLNTFCYYNCQWKW